MSRQSVRAVDYGRQTIDTPNPLARAAHRARLTRAVSTVAACAPPRGSVIDFGAGTGLFLQMLGGRRPDLRLVALEPDRGRLTFPCVVSSLEQLPAQSQDVVTAFEVCEHLSDDELLSFLDDARRILKSDGRLIVSVPIMHGLAAVPKEANRMILFRRKPELTVKELVWNVLGKRVSRPADRMFTHKGFCHRDFARVVAGPYHVERIFYSPLPRLPWWFNSQAFLICSMPTIRPLASKG